MKRKEKSNEMEVNEKHVPLRILGFVLALVLAVGAFTFGVTRIGYKDEGMYELTAAADTELPLYQSGIHAKFLFRGSSTQIKLALGQADKVYTEALKRNVKLLDAKQEYDGVVNVATLNARLNQDVTVSPALYAVLTDAWEKTRAGEGYSLFAGPLYAEWESILILTEPEDFDPLRNENEAERLRLLADWAGQIDKLRLVEVDAEQHILRVEASEDYLRFLEDMELEPRVLDLNLLREAYLLELTGKELEEQCLHEGYLSTDSGLILSLSGQSTGEYVLYGYRNQIPQVAATARVTPGSAYSQFTAFPLITGVQTEYYTLEEAGKAHLRNPWLPADGLDRELLLSSGVLRSDGALVEACFENIRLRSAESAAALEKLAGESAAAVAWMLQGDESVYFNAQADGAFASENK